MDFTMQMTAVGVREGASDKSVNLGTWKAGFNTNLSLLDPKSMTNYTADLVYRVVTVMVSNYFTPFNNLKSRCSTMH